MVYDHRGAQRIAMGDICLPRWEEFVASILDAEEFFKVRLTYSQSLALRVFR